MDVRPNAQQRLYALRGEPLEALNAWTEQYRQLWDERFTQLDGVLEDMKRDQKKRKKERRHGRAD